MLKMLLLVACVEEGFIDSVDTSDTVDMSCVSDLSWENFGAPLMLSWCTGCHHSQLPDADRAGAPLHINLDTHADVQSFAALIEAAATGEDPTMPPVGGPPETDRALLAEWLRCGAL